MSFEKRKTSKKSVKKRKSSKLDGKVLEKAGEEHASLKRAYAAANQDPDVKKVIDEWSNL